jgi:protein Tex
MEMIPLIAQELSLKIQQVQATLELLDDGNTLPFITRYRKEQTGNLDEEEIRKISECAIRIRQLEDRRQAILANIESQGKLTPEINQSIKAATDIHALEDLYLPYKQKRKTKAMEARRLGFSPLAGLLLFAVSGQKKWLKELAIVQNEEGALESVSPQKMDLLNNLAAKSVSPAEAVAVLCDTGTELEFALQKSRDIVAEVVNEDVIIRRTLRERANRSVIVLTKLADPEHADADRFKMYHSFDSTPANLAPHRTLAINRGEKIACLKVKLDWTEVNPEAVIGQKWINSHHSEWVELFETAVHDCVQRLLLPSLNRDLRAALTELAATHSLEVFSTNLKQLLMQPPVEATKVMGIDPGFRSGCKVAVIDETGHYLAGDTIYPHPPQKQNIQSKIKLLDMVKKYSVEIIAIGNGTASRESEELIAELISENQLDLKYCVVSEAGASVYSVSETAREEFPELEAAMRGNISIARRLVDPLAELVKIDPRSMGVGQYQHDIDPRELGNRLETVVESCVNQVGVDLNTASVSLLERVSGITRRTSRNIVDYRERNGAFTNRKNLLDVEGIGPSAFLQSAGFLRIRNGNNSLDNTAVHPESYPAVEKLANKFADSASDLKELATVLSRVETSKMPQGDSFKDLAESVGLGLPTLTDILHELKKPGRDPRENLDPPLLRGGITKLEDLAVGMKMDGTVRNLVDFGAFVDVGLKNDGLVHISQISHSRIKHPIDVLEVGQRIEVQVIEIDFARSRLALSIKELSAPPKRDRARGSQGNSNGNISSKKRADYPANSIGAMLADKLNSSGRRK